MDKEGEATGLCTQVWIVKWSQSSFLQCFIHCLWPYQSLWTSLNLYKFYINLDMILDEPEEKMIILINTD